jgi:hypothetical protein
VRQTRELETRRERNKSRKCLLHFLALLRGSAIGSTPAFGAGYPGSSPGPGATQGEPAREPARRLSGSVDLSGSNPGHLGGGPRRLAARAIRLHQVEATNRAAFKGAAEQNFELAVRNELSRHRDLLFQGHAALRRTRYPTSNSAQAIPRFASCQGFFGFGRGAGAGKQTIRREGRYWTDSECGWRTGLLLSSSSVL